MHALNTKKRPLAAKALFVSGLILSAASLGSGSFAEQIVSSDESNPQTLTIADHFNRSDYSDQGSIRFIIGRQIHTEANIASGLTEIRAKLKAELGTEVTWIRSASDGAEVFSIPANSSRDRLNRILAKMEDQGSIAYSQYDAPVITQSLPDDQLYPMQWPFHEQTRTPVAINLPAAWEISTGSAETIIAVVDTGVRFDHSDLSNRLLAGYDFVSGINEAPDTQFPVDSDFNFARSNDNDGRDPDATDPGDGVANNFRLRARNAGMNCETMDSTWHGTAMASLIAANANDGIGMVGIDWKAKILPVRAVGRCGGSRSDLLDAIRWAAGVEDPNLPVNPTPARIINLSLGIDDICGPADQRAIDDAIAAGAIVVAAVGNQGRNLDYSPAAPSDCKGVIGVGAVNAIGNRANYSNYGLDVDISAPGGENSLGDGREILVAANAGSVDPVPGSSHRYTSGTSVASPMVAGVLSLMLGANPSLTNDELEFLLYESSRGFERSIAGNRCDMFTCGSGMLDAHGAVLAAQASLDKPVEISERFRLREGDVTTGGGAGFGCTVGPKFGPTLLNTKADGEYRWDPTFVLIVISCLYASCRRKRLKTSECR